MILIEKRPICPAIKVSLKIMKINKNNIIDFIFSNLIIDEMKF